MDWSARYNTELSQLFSSKTKIAMQLQVECALIKALGNQSCLKLQITDNDIAQLITQSNKITVEQVKAIEAKTHHDIMAMVKSLTAVAPTETIGDVIHLGLTSQDINDTVTAMQMNQAIQTIGSSCKNVRKELTRLAKLYRNLACIGRTHGQHAIPTTYGFKFANYLYEFTTAASYLERVKPIGKATGAIGTFAGLQTACEWMSNKSCPPTVSLDISNDLLTQVGVIPAPICTQVVSRLTYADYVFGLTAISSVLERIAKEVRNLQRTELNELSEAFSATQVGSSTMPHKRNPHKCERICGLARVVRSQIIPALETISLEHERDLTNSACERVVLSTATILCHYLCEQMTAILSKLVVDKVATKQNLYLHNGAQLTERIMVVLAAKGVGRQQGHELMRAISAISSDNLSFEQRLRVHPIVVQKLTTIEIDELLDPNTYIGLAPQIVDKIVKEFGVVEDTTTQTT